MADAKHLWGGRPILDGKHAANLDADAALFEFRDGKERGKAEEEAYGSYKKNHHAQAAAYHLGGMRSAQGSGDTESAKKHRMMYELHVRQLGFDPSDAVPADVRQAMDHPDYKPAYRFKAHAADSFLLQKNEQGEYEVLAKGPIGPPRKDPDEAPPANDNDAYQRKLAEMSSRPAPKPVVEIPKFEAMNLNNVDNLRRYYGDRIRPDFNVSNASHWKELFDQMTPKERLEFGKDMFMYDSVNKRVGNASQYRKSEMWSVWEEVRKSSNEIGLIDLPAPLAYKIARIAIEGLLAKAETKKCKCGAPVEPGKGEPKKQARFCARCAAEADKKIEEISLIPTKKN